MLEDGHGINARNGDIVRSPRFLCWGFQAACRRIAAAPNFHGVWLGILCLRGRAVDLTIIGRLYPLPLSLKDF